MVVDLWPMGIVRINPVQRPDFFHGDLGSFPKLLYLLCNVHGEIFMNL